MARKEDFSSSLFGDDLIPTPKAPSTPEQNDQVSDDAPLAARMRPRALEEVVGQQHLIGEGMVLRKAAASGRLPSMILWGPPGCGKTTLAALLAKASGARFITLQAVSTGVADMRKVFEQARASRKQQGGATVLFLDEIHRLNKAQQDVVLPAVESGDITLIGATTENPSFEVNSALLSRSRVFVLKSLTDEQVGDLIDRALVEERGLAGAFTLDADARELLIAMASGDARTALTGLDLASSLDAHITLVVMQGALQRRTLHYDKAGGSHYDTISAFIKSVRGSDPDAALYWLLRMIESGEDPMFLARRLVILASEDIGLADPRALMLATAAQQATHLIGMPEAYYPLAQATLYLAAAPKSNSVGAARERAMADIENTRTDSVPLHLRNAPTALMKNLGYGAGYRNAHESSGHFDPQESFLPDALKDREYYQPTSQGDEERIKSRLELLRSKRKQK